MMKVSVSTLAALSCALVVAGAGCGGSSDGSTADACGSEAARTPSPAPHVSLTADEKNVWAPLPPDRSAVPVLLYHGIAPASDFSNATDASYGIDPADFAKQMTMIKHAGYQTIDLSTFLDFVDGKAVELPPRPLLLTFDDGRADSWTAADDILRELHFNAVMFVDTGRVDACDPEYLTWEELAGMQSSGRWELQLHSGRRGHQFIRYGLDPDDTGPFYAYEKRGEDFDQWQQRVRSDVEGGDQLLVDHIPNYRSQSFALPFGTYGQDGTNDTRIPPDFLGWLKQRYEAVFTQDQNALARPDATQPLGRIQVTRATSGGEVHSKLLTGT